MEKKAQYFRIDKGTRNATIIATDDIASVVHSNEEGKSVLILKSKPEPLKVNARLETVANFLPDLVDIEEEEKQAEEEKNLPVLKENKNLPVLEENKEEPKEELLESAGEALTEVKEETKDEVLAEVKTESTEENPVIQ